MSHAIDGFKQFLQRQCQLEAKAWQALLPHLHEQEINKHQTLLAAGERLGRLWFISQGVVRNLYLQADGREFNKSFVLAPGFCGSMVEWISGQSSRFSIQALEPTVVVAVDMGVLSQLMQQYDSLMRLQLTMLQHLVLKKEAREAAFLLDDAKARYQQFLLDYPSLPGRIPDYQIASYLGITPVALSRLKSQSTNR